MSLHRLAVRFLPPYRGALALVVVFQTIATFAAMTLPGLNSDLIDNGVLVGDDAYIRRTGAVMLFFSLVQVVFSVAAVWFGIRVAMGFGRDAF